MIVHIQLTEKCNVLCGYHLVEKDCDFHVLILMGKKKKNTFWKEDPGYQVLNFLGLCV